MPFSYSEITVLLLLTLASAWFLGYLLWRASRCPIQVSIMRRRKANRKRHADWVRRNAY